MDERLTDSLMNSFENSNQQTDMLIEEEKTEQHTDVLPKEEEALRPYVFYFNNYFVSAGLVAYVGGNLAQMSSQIKMKEEDSMEEFNPWKRDVKLLQRMMESRNSMQIEIIVKEGKDEREASRTSEEQVRNQQLHSGSNQQQFEELVDNNNDLKQRKRGNNEWNNMDQPKEMLEMEIEELW